MYKLVMVKDSSIRLPEGTLRTGADAVQVFQRYLAGLDREHFLVLALNPRLEMIGMHTVSIGTTSNSPAQPREIFKMAILANAHAIMVGHNHPTSDATPSPGDEEFTQQLKAAGELLAIRLLDHIIIGGDGSVFSFANQQLL